MSRTLIVERDVETPMRDGVILRADVYRLADAGPLPVLLQRTPYGKNFSQNAFALLAAERGYAVVIQDTRGRWSSDGDGYPFIHEMADGHDTVMWAACQPWANGAVGMFGGSYVGFTQLAAAVMQPPPLKAIVPAVTFCDPYRIMFAGGALALGAAVSWNLVAGAQMAIMRSPAPPEEKERWTDQLVALADGMARGETFTRRPLDELPLIGRGGIAPFFADLLAHQAHDDYWQPITCAHDRITVPALHIGGWYDIFAASTVSDFAAILRNGGSATARISQRLLMGPWLHGPMEGLVGQVDFGLRASSLLVLPDEIQLRWFDHWLRGIPNGMMDEPPVRIFVMGTNEWRDEQEWPLARGQYTRYYLHSGGAANSRRGDGGLNPQAPGQESADAFLYDPRHPTPTRGGGLCCWSAAIPGGAFDQREIEDRFDVLVYTSPPLEHDLEVTGPLEVHLWAASSATDTDFTAKLVDVGPCGFARNIQDGIIRASYRAATDQPQPIKPSEVYHYVIALGATSNVFQAGHRIRLEISSSNFPRYNRNPNTGGPLGQETVLRPAMQTVFHDASRPSHIVLPIIPRAV